MLPRRRVSAPESRVYESGPTLNQAKFKSPPKIKKKRVKSYGKKTTVRVPKPKDNTLTQMGFVTNNSPPDPESDEGDEGYEELAEKRRTKRRKTTGDRSSTTTEFHTQTISQLVRSFSSAHDLEKEEQGHVQEHDIFDVPSSSPGHHQRKPPRRGRSLAPGKENQAPTASTQGLKESEKSIFSEKSQDRAMMPPPQTPRRTRALEIPSSESPATPFSLPSHGSLRAFPLQEQATNIPINFGSRRTPEGSADLARQDEPASTKSLKPVQFPLFFNDNRTSRESPGLDSGSIPELPQDRKPVEYPLFWNPNPRRGAETSPDRVPKLEIKDTYETAADTSQITRLPSSPILTRSSPPKSVRFAVSDESMAVETPRVSLSKQPSLTTSQPPITKSIKTEILDSDAESEDEYYSNDEEKVELTEATNIQENDHEVKNEDPFSPVRGDIIEDGGHSLNYGDGEADAEEPTIQPEHAHEVNKEAVGVLGEEYSSGVDHESDYGVIGAETQFQVDKIISSSHLDDPQEAHSEDTVHETVTEKTQYMATQRIDTQYMNTMSARTAESDVFISMSSAELTTMLDRTRNHLIRNWKLAPKVCRIWIYETQPVSSVQYMAEISCAKRPGQLPEHGVNNGAFNARPVNTTYNAYEILQLYELIDPVQLDILLERGWFDEPPRRWQKVAPAVIDELVCNLKPPLFHVERNVQSPPSSVTDTQEVDGQLLSNMQQFTQQAGGDEERIPSSPFRLPTLKARSSIKGKGREVQHDLPPSQATTVDLSQAQTPRKRQSSVEIIMESPTRPTRVEVPSSTPLQLPKLRTPVASACTKECAIDYIEEDAEPESLVPYSMASSQLKLLTKSQLLSDTLLQDSIPGPPEWVADSEEDDDYDDL
jgi:hypothetical protein